MRRKIPEEDLENLKESDIIGEVKVTIDKDAFRGPFTCCGRKTKKATKHSSSSGLELTHKVWKCGKCDQEYVDSKLK